jgi:hypothetical protein
MVKNLIPVLHRSYRCPATDGALLTPYIKRWFKFEKDIERKVEEEAERILHEFNKKQHKVKLPRFNPSQ